jgi:hypothetical protein
MSRLPDDLRANLPDDLAEAQLAGIDIADVDENVRLWGPTRNREVNAVCSSNSHPCTRRGSASVTNDCCDLPEGPGWSSKTAY